jgi:hypothetical protein
MPCPSNYSRLDHPVKTGNEYKPWSYSLCVLLHSRVTSLLLGPNIFLSTLFSNVLSLLPVKNQIRIYLFFLTHFRTMKTRSKIDVCMFLATSTTFHVPQISLLHVRQFCISDVFVITKCLVLICRTFGQSGRQLFYLPLRLTQNNGTQLRNKHNALASSRRSFAVCVIGTYFVSASLFLPSGCILLQWEVRVKFLLSLSSCITYILHLVQMIKFRLLRNHA